MASLNLTEQQVFELAMQLPPSRRQELASALTDSNRSAELADEGGIMVIQADRAGDIESIVTDERDRRVEESVSEMLR